MLDLFCCAEHAACAYKLGHAPQASMGDDMPDTGISLIVLAKTLKFYCTRFGERGGKRRSVVEQGVMHLAWPGGVPCSYSKAPCVAVLFWGSFYICRIFKKWRDDLLSCEHTASRQVLVVLVCYRTGGGCAGWGLIVWKCLLLGACLPLWWVCRVGLRC